VFFGQAPDLPAVIGIALIVTGIAAMNVLPPPTGTGTVLPTQQ